LEKITVVIQAAIEENQEETINKDSK
jgi:hypothetical protein